MEAMVDDSQTPPPLRAHPRAASADEAGTGTTTSHGIEINVPDDGQHRPTAVRHLSSPAYQSPIRHHRRVPSKSTGVKETLNARSHYGSSDDDGGSIHRINQYIIKQEIGRGSFGAVHLALDQFGKEYAVKEFSKSRLRKRAQSNLLRKPAPGRRPGHLAANGLNSPLHRQVSSDRSKDSESNNSLSLIKEEIAIMKKLDHHNLVTLIEVLDDPQEDSLYVVLEMCKKGVVMKVGLDERAEPYPDEACRCWFRDMILGIEYLHAQGIIHRDIKPDNCLITDEDVLKIVDFGVSEMFEKESDMSTAKSAGSPAFMPPELCVVKHGQISGRAADIWSMGVTLYCLRYGHIPFEKHGMLELYESIRNDPLPLDEEKAEDFADLMRAMLEKDPDKRITMDKLRNGTDPLLSAEENCADIVGPATDAELANAITGNMSNLLAVMKAVKRFKHLLLRRRPHLMDGIFGRESKIVAPPGHIRSTSQKNDNRIPINRALVTEGVHQDPVLNDELRKPAGQPNRLAHVTSDDSSQLLDHETAGLETRAHRQQREETSHHQPFPNASPGSLSDHQAPGNTISRAATFPSVDHAKGHAHDPLADTLFLDVGAGVPDGNADADESEHALEHIVSESPPGVDDNIYERAYQEELQRILSTKGKDVPLYLTRRVEHRHDLREHTEIAGAINESGEDSSSARLGSARAGGGGLAGLIRKAQQAQQAQRADNEDGGQKR
nr:calcium/calmodulin-dependent protein kinase kinase 1 [Quercus suber]